MASIALPNSAENMAL